jgi:hypothetical protein
VRIFHHLKQNNQTLRGYLRYLDHLSFEIHSNMYTSREEAVDNTELSGQMGIIYYYCTDHNQHFLN